MRVMEVHLLAGVGISGWIAHKPLPGLLACEGCGAKVHPEEGQWDMLSLASSAPREAH